MARPKLIVDKSTEELLESLETDQDDIYIEEEEKLISFFKYFNILPGKKHIAINAVYELYKQWSMKPVTKQKFFIFVRNHFSCFYGKMLINTDILNIDESIFKHFKSKKKPINPNKYKSFMNFINTHGITQGSYKAPSYGVFMVYQMWCIKRNKKPNFSFLIFHTLCTSMFKTSTTKAYGPLIHINESILTHSTEEYLRECAQTYVQRKK